VSISLIKSASVDNISLFSRPPELEPRLVDYLLPLHKLALGTEVASTASTDSGAANTTGFYFNYDPGISPKVREWFINTLVEIGKQAGTLDAKQESDLHLLLGEIDIMETIGGALKSKGHPPHSLATASAYWLVSLLEVVHNQSFTEQQYTAVLRQLEQTMVSPEYDRMSDAEKQALSERLMWEALLHSVQWKQARENGQSTEAVSAIARGLLLNHLDIDANLITVGDQGLEAK